MAGLDLGALYTYTALCFPYCCTELRCLTGMYVLSCDVTSCTALPWCAILCCDSVPYCKTPVTLQYPSQLPPPHTHTYTQQRPNGATRRGFSRVRTARPPRSLVSVQFGPVAATSRR